MKTSYAICFKKMSVFAIALFIVPLFAFSASTTYTDAGSGLWSDPLNWSNGVPANGDDVFIIPKQQVLINVAPNTLNSLTLTGQSSGSGSVATLVLIGDGNSLTITGNLTITGGSSLARSAYVIVGDASTNGGVPPYTPTSLTVGGDITFTSISNGRAILDITTQNGDFANSLSVGGNITATTKGTLTATTITSSNATITFNGAGTQTISIGDGSGNAVSYGNIVIANTGTVKFNNVAGNVINSTSLSGNVTVNAGAKLDNNGMTVAGNTATFTVNGTYVMSGTTTWPTAYTIALGGASTIEWGGTTQTVSIPPNAQQYFNVTISGSLTKTLNAAQDMNGKLKISAGTLDAAGFQVNLAGDFQNDGTFTSNNNTIVFDGNSTISGSSTTTFNNVTLDPAGTLSLGAVTKNIAGTVLLNAGGTLNLGTGTTNMTAASATWTNDGATIVTNAGTVDFQGAGTHTLNGAAATHNFHTLIFTGTLTAPAILNIAGDFTNNGIFTYGTGIVDFNGAGTQAIGGSATNSFYSMKVSTNAHTVNLSSNADLYNRIDITNGATFDADGTANDKTFQLKSVGQYVAPVGNTASIGDLSSGTITGSIVLERYIYGYTGWRQLACPITGKTIASWDDELITSGFTGSDDPSNPFKSILTYNEAGGAYVSATNTTDPISADDVGLAGKGFLVYVGNTNPGKVMSSPIITYVGGVPITGTQTISVTSGAGTGYNLIQNPFPSVIDFDNLTRNSVNNNFWVYDAYAGNYATWDGSLATGRISNGLIANGQSFWVQASGAGSVVFNENDKATGSDQAFLKLSNATAYKHIRLHVDGGNYPFNDEAIVGFDSKFSDGLVANEDIGRFNSSNALAPSLSTITANKDLAFNKFSMPASTFAVPVRVKVGVGQSGSYTIAAPEIDLDGTCITLEDKLTGTMTDLRSSSYTFNISDTTKAPRFILHISTPTAASFTASKDTVSIGSPVSFTNSSTGASSFTWNFGDGTTAATQNTSHTYVSAGDYTVTLTAVGTCGSIATTQIIHVESPLGIKNIASNNNVSVISNSNGVFVKLDFDQVVNGTIEVFDVLGKNIHTQNFSGSTNLQQVNIPAVGNGVYLVRVLTGSTTLVKRIFIGN